MAPPSFSFGIEIEMVAVPKNQAWRGQSHNKECYEALAQALQRHGISAFADHVRRRHPEEYNERWLITRDGSLITSSDSGIALEAVSRILHTNKAWEDEIVKFWKAQSEVFRMPMSNHTCGSHVHVSTRSGWTTQQIRDIAVGIVAYEAWFQDLLPVSRRQNVYCLKNSARSSRLRQYAGGTNISGLAAVMRDMSKSEVVSMMQDDRRVQWNFEHVAGSDTGTIEFRGGRCLRGPVRTKRWIAFAISYLYFLLKQEISSTGRYTQVNSTAELYALVRQAASAIDMRRHLPVDMYKLNEEGNDEGYPAEPPPVYSPRSRTASIQGAQSGSYEESHRHTSVSSGDNLDWLSWRFLMYAILRFVQVILSIAAMGVFAHNIDVAHSSGQSISGSYPFALIVSLASIFLGGITAFIYLRLLDDRMFEMWKWQWVLDLIMAFFWLVVFGIFATNSSVVYLLLVQWLSWILTAVFSAFVVYNWGADCITWCDDCCDC